MTVEQDVLTKHEGHVEHTTKAKRAWGMLNEGLKLLRELGHCVGVVPVDAPVPDEFPKMLYKAGGEQRIANASFEEEELKAQGFAPHPSSAGVSHGIAAEEPPLDLKGKKKGFSLDS